jgi:Arc/MetJ-type ribon-helix-helix transcriptional regulator
MTVRLNNRLAEAGPQIENGTYENESEYMRDLIRRDMERMERDSFERLKAELDWAFSAPDSSYAPLTAAEAIGRNQAAVKKMTDYLVQEAASHR